MIATNRVKIAGCFSSFFFFFHIPFYWLFDWANTLSSLSNNNWAIFHCFNIICISLLLLMAVASLLASAEMVTTQLGRYLSIFCTWFYMFRIIAEFTLFREEDPAVSAAIVVLCAIPACLYGSVAMRLEQKR